MRAIIVPLAGLSALALGAGTASAASPTYCALYAKEFVNRTIADGLQGMSSERLRSQVYHKCLNRDEEPLLPMLYADPADADAGTADTKEAGSSVEETLPAAAAASPEEGTAALEPAPEPPGKTRRKKPVSAVGRVVDMVQNLWKPRGPSVSAQVLGGSGLPMWTADWEAWCTKHFPNSFDRRTGTVVPIKTGVRTRC